MQLFANTRDFKIALLEVIRHAGQPNPQRHALAAELESIAEKLGAKPRTRKKAPAKGGPPASGRQVLVNIAEREHKALKYLMFSLTDAVADIKSEIRHVEDAIENLRDDTKADERELEPKELEAAWSEPASYFVGGLLDQIRKGIDYLADTLEDNVRVTQEDELAQAVRAFHAKIPKDGEWPTGKGEKHFDAVQKAFANAIAKLPTGLSKRSELTKLRSTFEEIGEVIKLITGKSISVPKIPNALDPEDPRQLGFGFEASQRIANTLELESQLAGIWRAAQGNPSRMALRLAMLDLAGRLR